MGKIHAKGIVHRDVAPDNILINKDEVAKLIDFGAARYSTGEKSKSLDVIIKHGFAPMEQYSRRGKQGPFTDVYALAATYYYAITGKVPPDAVDREVADEMIMPSDLGVQLGRSAEYALLKALDVNPAARYQRMDQFHDAMIAAMPEYDPERKRREAKEKRLRLEAEKLAEQRRLEAEAEALRRKQQAEEAERRREEEAEALRRKKEEEEAQRRLKAEQAAALKARQQAEREAERERKAQQAADLKAKRQTEAEEKCRLKEERKAAKTAAKDNISEGAEKAPQKSVKKIGVIAALLAVVLVGAAVIAVPALTPAPAGTPAPEVSVTPAGTTAPFQTESPVEGIVWSFDEYSGTLSISGEGEMTDAPWAELSDRIEHVKIEEGVTNIARCFQGLQFP